MARSGQRGEQDVAVAAERLAGLVLGAVAQTLETDDVAASRAYLSSLAVPPNAPASDEDRSTELMVTLILVRWISVARDELPEDADRVTDVLGWVKEHLGPRFASRARYTVGPLQGEDQAADIMQYRTALGGDFLPSLVWLLAGIVACYGGGDVAWLRGLVGAAPTSA